MSNLQMTTNDHEAIELPATHPTVNPTYPVKNKHKSSIPSINLHAPTQPKHISNRETQRTVVDSPTTPSSRRPSPPPPSPKRVKASSYSNQIISLNPSLRPHQTGRTPPSNSASRNPKIQNPARDSIPTHRPGHVAVQAEDWEGEQASSRPGRIFAQGSICGSY